jgi:hypothetical protein
MKTIPSLGCAIARLLVLIPFWIPLLYADTH